MQLFFITFIQVYLAYSASLKGSSRPNSNFRESKIVVVDRHDNKFHTTANAYWIISSAGLNCNEVCTQSTIGGSGVCLEDSFNAVTTLEAFDNVFSNSVYSSSCQDPGTVLFNQTVTATTFCNSGINNAYDLYTYPFPAFKIASSLGPGENGGTVFKSDLTCGFATTSGVTGGRCEISNPNLNRFCPCDVACETVL
jgi:hypothetical protein